MTNRQTYIYFSAFDDPELELAVIAASDKKLPRPIIAVDNKAYQVGLRGGSIGLAYSIFPLDCERGLSDAAIYTKFQSRDCPTLADFLFQFREDTMSKRVCVCRKS